MRSLLFVLLIAVGAAADSTEEITERRVTALLKLHPRQLKLEVWKLPKADREKLIQEYKSKLHPSAEKDSIRKKLVVWGDREAAREGVATMVSDPTHSHGNLGYSGNPYVVEFLAPHFYRDEPFSVAEGDVMSVPLSFMAASVAAHVLADSSAFNGEVISWARRLRDGPVLNVRPAMRQWWQENESLFLKEEFLAVKPGLPIAAVSSSRNEDPQGSSTVATTSTGSVAANQPISESTDSNPFLYVGIGALVLVVALFAVMVRRRWNN